MAYRAGVLTGKDQSRIQRWALGYYQFSEMRDRGDHQYEVKRLLHFILRGVNAKLYDLAYPSPESDDPDLIPGHSYGVEDLGELEKLLKRWDSENTKTQASLSKTEWTEWE